MLYYISVADNHTGKFVGGAYLNAESDADLETQTAALLKPLGATTCFEMLIAEVPAGAQYPIPAIGRLLTRAELEAAAPVVSFNVSNDGTIERAQ